MHARYMARVEGSIFESVDVIGQKTTLWNPWRYYALAVLFALLATDCMRGRVCLRGGVDEASNVESLRRATRGS